MSSPFAPNLKLEAMYAAVALEKARLASDCNPQENDELIKDMEAIHAWLTKT